MPEPFASDENARRVLASALHVGNGIEGMKADAPPYFLRVKLRSEPVETVTLSDNAAKSSYFVAEGLTLGGVKNPAALDASRFAPMNGAAIAPATEKWLREYSLISQNPFPPNARKNVGQLARLLATFPNDVKYRSIAVLEKRQDFSNRHGPRVKFFGSPLAALLTAVYRENARNSDAR